VVYLQKKKKQAVKGLDKHIVEESGETLRDIAQRYGVRLSSLLRMNRFPEGYVPKEDEVIILRK
jgi:LysM repeat protein